MLGTGFTIFVLLIRNIFIEAYSLGDLVEMAAKDYLFIVALGLIFFFKNPIFSQSFTALGDSVTRFKSNALGLIVNMILDPMLIFGLGPFPSMGVKGAALATIFSQFMVSFLFIYAIIKRDGLIKKALTRIDYGVIDKKNYLN